MKRIDVVVETGELSGIRDALREIGINTMRVSEFDYRGQTSAQSLAGGPQMNTPRLRPIAKISVVVPDNLTDRVIMTFISGKIKKSAGDGKHFVPSIERIVRLDADKQLESGV